MCAQKLRRYTGLNHLAQAARGVLKSRQSIEQMQEDYEKVDFVTIKDQIFWLHTCDFELITKFVAITRDEPSGLARCCDV
jgi:hypothetical protein